MVINSIYSGDILGRNDDIVGTCGDCNEIKVDIRYIAANMIFGCA